MKLSPVAGVVVGVVASGVLVWCGVELGKRGGLPAAGASGAFLQPTADGDEAKRLAESAAAAAAAHNLLNAISLLVQATRSHERALAVLSRTQSDASNAAAERARVALQAAKDAIVKNFP